MPIYSAKPDTQYAAPGPLPVPGSKLLYERFTRLLFGGRVIFCCQAPWCLMLSIESMIAISSRRGGGGRQTFPVPLSRKFFALFVVPFMFPRPGPCCKGCGPGEGNRGGNVGYYGCPCCGAQNFCAALRRTLEILTAATRSPRFIRHRRRSDRSPRARCALAMTKSV